MRQFSRGRLGIHFTVVVAALAAAPFATAQPRSSTASGDQAPRALVDQYCVGCHSQKLKTAGVALESLDFANVPANSAVLEKVLRKVRAGDMPPAGLPRPTAAVAASFTRWLEASLDRAAAAHPNPGRPAIHRLNRAEYSNSIRDLLDLDIQPGALLPIDDSGYGFDNIGDVLSVSPAHLERYMQIARRVSRLAVGDLSMKPGADEYPFPTGGRGARNERASDDLPFDSVGGMAVKHYFPVDAEYNLRIKLPGDTGKFLESRQPVSAGMHTIGVAFLRESTKPEVVAGPGGRRGGGGGGFGGRGGGTPPPPAELDLRLDGARLKRFELPQNGPGAPGLDKLIVAGPYNITGRGTTPTRARIFVCRPATTAEEEPCARTILANLGRRAFRRPVTGADLKPLLAFYESGRKEADFDHGIEAALGVLLVSPDFLFRVERDPQGLAPGAAYRIGDFELASRLSFFLWSSMPDDQLLSLAEKGKLKDPAVLQAQVRRMLDDPKSEALVSNFAGQWLSLRNLGVQKPDPDIFPEFDESLRTAFRRETELFFASILREDRGVLDLLDANYTFVNERLARHYDIPNIYGAQFRRVTLTDPSRGGLLGQGSILTVTSYPNRTSVVQRGKWVLENLLGTPPPPPPPDVPDLQAHGKDGKQLTMRQAMEQHRANPVCASCHARMDPIGFALENYDGVGKWRTQDAGSTIDASGKLPDGGLFTGPAGLRKILLSSHRDEFVGTFTEKFLLYALGRGLESYDLPAVRAIEREAAQNGYRMSSFVQAIVASTPFQMRRTSEP